MMRIKRPYRKNSDRLYENRAWRRAKAAMQRYSGGVKAGLVARWRVTTDADDPGRLLAMVHQYDNGKLMLSAEDAETYTTCVLGQT